MPIEFNLAPFKFSECARCNKQTEDLVLCRWEVVPGSAGIIRPLCPECRKSDPL